MNGLYVQAHVTRQPIPRGQWARLVLDVDFARGSVNLSANGALVIDREPLAYPQAAPQVPSIQVGTLTDNITFTPSACTVRVDDVTFDVQP